ncbi:MAG: Ig-like domain repeat protein, partial [Acidobacteriia bacterium]|nr:Ig-like domain repeat protein [Terriglobia bacterium]
RVSNGRTVIEFSGTASQVLQAFHTPIHKYTVAGKDHWANASDPQIPMALAPVIAGIDTLHNFGRKPMHHVAGVFGRSEKTGAVQAVKPLFTYPGGCGSSASSPCYAVGPADFAKIYDVPNLLLNPAPGTVLNGDGVTIAIAGESNINVQDVRDFRSMFGLAAKDPVIVLDGPDPGIVGGVETEADLDVEWSGAVAPNATIDLVVAESTETSQGVDLAAEHVVDNNLAPILSESFGYCEAGLGAAGNQFYSQLWQQAAAQGITVLISTGDSGAAGCDYSASFPSPAQYGLQISGIASTPYNVAVGGTDFNDLNNYAPYWNTTSPTTNATLESALGYIPEMTWNDSCTNSETFVLTGAPSAEPNCNSASLNAFFVNTIGGSGGKSSCINGNGTTLSSCTQGYAKPTWQTGTGVPPDSLRDIPDVSLFAADGLNGNFYIICESDATGGAPCSSSNFLGVGGTSASTPSFAGIMALVNQKTAARQGNANYILYKLAASTPSAFHDVTTGTIAMPCAKGTLNCTVNTSSDQYGVLSGYATTTGYDLATGLGTIDATNLVNAWATAAAALKPTATTLTLNGGTTALSITHGASVSVGITAAATPPGTGTPTGNVSLIANTGPSGQTGVQSATLSNGSASFNTTLLPGGGPYNVIAHYAGDGIFQANDSTPAIPVTVAKENSRLQIGIVTFSGNTITSANATSFAYGSPYILRMDILNSTANACQPVTNGVITGCAFDARGSVSVTDTFNSVTSPLDAGTFAVNSEGYTEDQPIQLPAGTHNLSATYSGDNSYNGSGPSTVTLTVSQAATTTSVASSATSIGYGGTVTLTATIGSNSNSSAGPTGTVQFLNNGSNFGTATCTPAGATATAGASCTATLPITALPLGTDKITAQYPGDANYSSSSTTASASVQILATTTTVVSTGAGATVWQGQSVTFTAKVTPNQGSGAVTGTVQFTANGTSIGSGTLSSGQAQVTTSALPLGTVQIVATYGGDSNNASSTSAQLTETVNTAYTVAANPTTIPISAPGQSGSTTLTFTSLNSFAGSVTLSSANCSNLPTESSCSFNPATITLTANGTATTTMTVTTTAASLVAPGTGHRRTPPSWRNIPGSVALTCFLLMILAGLAALGLRGTQRRWNFVLGFAVFVLLVLNVGCGGGSGGGGGITNPGTPVGSKTAGVTVTINGVAQSTNVTVNVQ